MIYPRTDKPGNGGSLFSVGQLGNAMPESMAYNSHHFNCPECQAAGRLTPGARRCEVGHPLWTAYVQSVVRDPLAAFAAIDAGARWVVDRFKAATSDAHQRSGAALGAATPHGNYGGNVSEASDGVSK